MAKFLSILKFSSVILLLLIGNSGHSQSNGKAKYYIDSKGKKIPTDQFAELQKKEDLAWAFRKTKDSGNVVQLKNPVFEAFHVDYLKLKSGIETLTNQKHKDATIFLISYIYLNDPCSDTSTNNISYEVYNSKKEFYDQVKNFVEKKYPNLVYLVFFEEGIKINPTKNNPNNYFITDRNNFLKSKFFRHPTLCGSEMIINTDGNILVRNGESRGDFMASNLNPVIWNSFFSNSAN